MTPENKLKRFWSKVNKNTPNGCWEWTGALHYGNNGKSTHGYGRFNNTYAHRFSSKLHGEDPDGYYVCHKCNNSKCVNPDHLYLGTPADNMLDKSNCGNSHYKFKREFLISIKPEFIQAQKNKKVSEFAKKYGINRTYCYRAFKNI